MAEERTKIISLDILEYYDEKVKNWVMNRISEIEKGEVTEQEVKDMIAEALDKFVVEENLTTETQVNNMIKEANDLYII